VPHSLQVLRTAMPLAYLLEPLQRLRTGRPQEQHRQELQKARRRAQPRLQEGHRKAMPLAQHPRGHQKETLQEHFQLLEQRRKVTPLREHHPPLEALQREKLQVVPPGLQKETLQGLLPPLADQTAKPAFAQGLRARLEPR